MISETIARRSPIVARVWVQKLRESARRASWQPYSARVVPEIGRHNVREAFLRSYRIVYQVVDGGIRVLTVFEGHRLIPDIDPNAVD